jgi:hypothetical protein
MEKRVYKRVPVLINAKIYCGNALYAGTVTNLSKNGMCIKTGLPLPDELSFEVIIPSKDLDFLVEFRRAVETFGAFDTWGVEIMNPPKKYLEFLNHLKPTS